MESYENVELTFKELAQIALGTPRLTCVNTAVLHSLLNLILKKLDCQSETVSIEGFESMCIDEMHCQSNISPLVFNDEKLDIPFGKFENLDEMEKQISEMEAKVDEHLREIQRKLDPETDPIPPCHPIIYDYEVCEDLCVVCDPESRVACQLLQSTDFVKKLMRRMAAPIVERIFALEKKLDIVEEELCCMINRAEKQYVKVGLIENLIDDIEALRQLFNENYNKFLETMEELQDMLDAKVDKFHMQPLKKYIQKNIDGFMDILFQVQEQANCTKAAGIVWEDRNPAPKEPEKPAKTSKFCGCTGECLASTRELSLMQRVKATNVDLIAMRLEAKGARRSEKVDGFSGRVMLVDKESMIFVERDSRASRQSKLIFDGKLLP